MAPGGPLLRYGLSRLDVEALPDQLASNLVLLVLLSVKNIDNGYLTCPGGPGRPPLGVT